MHARREFLAAFSACALGWRANMRPASAAEAPASIAIAYQYGYAYAPLIIMKEQRTLEQRFPGTSFAWRVFANGSAIRDGIVANQIQIGAGGTAPFLIGWDKGVGWRLLGSLCDIDLWLVARDPSIKTLKDLRPGMKIGLPAPDSIQAIVLRRAAQEQLGDARALDNDLVAISHPLGLAALGNGQISAHFSNPPFQFEEVEQGGHVILRSFDVFGVSTLDSVFAGESFAQAYPNFVKTFYGDLRDAIDMIDRQPARAAELLSRSDGGKVSPATYTTWLAKPGTKFTIVPHGYLKYAAFMRDIGLIGKIPSSVADLELQTLEGVGS